MDDLELWTASNPAFWRLAATDWRRVYAARMAPRRGREQFAANLKYASPSKTDALAGEGRQLLAAAEAGEARRLAGIATEEDNEMITRLQRAEALGTLLS